MSNFKRVQIFILFLIIALSCATSICFALSKKELPPDIPEFKETTNTAEVVAYENALIKKSNLHFDEVVSRINKNFSKDKNFISHFNKSVSIFKNTRTDDFNMIFQPNQDYGVSREETVGSFVFFINRNKLTEYKRVVKDYCFHNSYLYDGNECSETTIENIFQ